MNNLNVTAGFIFGTLSSNELRIASLAKAGRGVYHDDRTEPRDPEPSQPVTITISVGTNLNARAPRRRRVRGADRTR